MTSKPVDICVLCNSPGELTPEHIFPEAIGGSLTIPICRDCNVYLGANVDVHLTDHQLVKMKRITYKIRGKKGALPNPLPGTITAESGRKARFEVSKKTGEPVGFRTLTSYRDLGNDLVEFYCDERESEDAFYEMVRKFCENREMEPPSREKLFAGIQKSKNPETANYEWAISLTEIRLAIFKIALELGVWLLGPTYMEDPIAKLLKALVFGKMQENEIDRLSFVQPLVITVGPKSKLSKSDVNWDFLWSGEERLHLAILHSTEQGVVCFIRVFDDLYASLYISKDTWEFASPTCIVLDSVNRTHDVFRGLHELTMSFLKHLSDTSKNSE